MAKIQYDIRYKGQIPELWIDVLLYQDWSMLKQLILSKYQLEIENCNIGKDNIQIITYKSWPNLVLLDLCCFIFIQKITNYKEKICKHLLLINGFN